jgi:GrpB-like predicted nucleotidyltransferase (UPF0157 family)
MAEKFEIKSRNTEVMNNERHRILQLFREKLPNAEVAEVGSTSVDGAIGKQDIDFVVLVLGEEFESVRLILDSLFERDSNQLSSSCFQAYKASKLWDVTIQLTIKGGDYDTFHAFADILRDQPTVLAAYNQLKREWQGRPMNLYREAKAAFIERILKSQEK